MATKRSPADFLKQILGRPVSIKLHTGFEYVGILVCLDGDMNIVLDQA
jgi:U6 snRNA-associated Sm-like protein LSm6